MPDNKEKDEKLLIIWVDDDGSIEKADSYFKLELLKKGNKDAKQ